ncbi:MAG TPA: LamG-like jellyroll fold domain-containing protein [Candidatus Sulfotelmatobacter sp.]|nr:LamG-like jellyroll fold domain-containing protein [Candidatus Sulfotelmatobacter sp.]
MKTEMRIIMCRRLKTFVWVAWNTLTLCAVLTGGLARGQAPVIDPTGSTYTGVSASSSYSSSYLPANLFSYNVTGIATNSTLANTAEWATAGSLVGYVAFQLNNSFNVSSLYYAQRNSGRSTVDQMNTAMIWASTNTPFDPNNPPGTPPDATVTLNPTGSQVWDEYSLGTNITGQYFLIEFTDTNDCCNPGGNQLRLGGSLSSIVAPYFTQYPASQELFAGRTANFSVIASDGNTAPFTYQWSKGSTVLSDGGRISGSATANLVISDLVSTDSAAYTCTIANSVGSTNAAANLTVLTGPNDAVGKLIVSNSPIAYWRMDETSGTNAFDNIGEFDGTYGPDSTLGNASMTPPAFPGFYAGNTCVGMIEDDANSAISVPPLNLNTNTVTMIAWLNPAEGQDEYASLIVWRASAAYGLLAYQPTAGAPNTLSFIWNNIGWYENSGLVLPTNQWCMAALVVTATNDTLYLGSQGALNSYTSANNNPPAAFNTSMFIGCDSGSRTFNGLMDDISLFNKSLTAQQIGAIYAAGVGEVPPGISQDPVSVTNYVGGTANFSILATGSGDAYQWLEGTTALTNGGNISGAYSTTLSIANVSSNNVGNYSCIVSNSLGSLTSSSASLTVIPVPTNAYVATVVSYDPVAYWQLNDPSGSTVAADYWGGYNGTVLPDAALGVPGPQPPAFPGFSANNTALETSIADGNSTVEIPALNLNKNTATLLMWINPNTGGPGTFGGQVSYASLFANRSGGYFVFNYTSDGNDLSYQWDDYGWDSGITVPNYQWEFVGMVIGPTNTTVYLGTGGALTNSSLATVNAVASMAGPGYLGSDSGNSTRVFVGDMNNVAFFNRSLSPNDVTTIYNSALGLAAMPPMLNWSVTPSGLVLTWYGPFTLMEANSVNGPWTPANVSSGTTIPMTGAKQFYRLEN